MAREKKQKEEVVKGRTLLVTEQGGTEFKITIPAGGRVTFGPTVPYAAKAQQFGSSQGWSLRVYESAAATSLIACFSGVAAFRDVDIPHARAIVKESGKTLWKSDETGYEVTESVQREQSFIDSAKLLKG